MIRILSIAAFFLVAGCAQVPTQSVELSATVGRDIAEVHAAHRELAKVLFDRIRGDINRFVDDVYAPHQIRFALDEDRKRANSTNPDERRRSLLLAINRAFQPDAPAALQANVLKGMEILVTKIQADVESKRKELVRPIDAQEKTVLGAIDRAYQQIHYANSIVTGYLSSVAKVHEAQANILAAIGVDKDLRSEIAPSLADAAERISGIVEGAGKVDTTLERLDEIAGDLKEAVDKIGSAVSGIKER